VAFWLFKSEPDDFSWDDLVARGEDGEEWTGVRNYQARNNMRKMALGDRGFFYHSVTGLEIVGIVEICAEAHPDSTADSDKWDCVDVRAVVPAKTPVSLDTIKAHPDLADMAIVKQSRLSVAPVTEAEWKVLCGMMGVAG
jgi:predicted RNA-binding protein with PUA-like domain